jgi:4-hydroxy-tetrahydrodipicolinate reductase
MKKSLNILLIGYGKMGKEVESVALDKGHRIVDRIDQRDDWNLLNPKEADVAIDFSMPEIVNTNIARCIDLNIPLVMGTTGWYNSLKDIEENVIKRQASLIWASNFSPGVYILSQLNLKLAEWIKDFDYDTGIHEIHHTQKLDAPSGTAITLAKGILSKIEKFNNWELLEKGQTARNNRIPITYDRVADVKGTHIITYESKIDKISLKHEAKSRKGFAIGAVLAAEWLVGKTGFYNINDLFGQ